MVAIDHCVAYQLSADGFHRFLREYNGAAAFQDYLISKLSETVPYQVQLVHLASRQRIARLMLELVALADPHDPHRLVIPFSQTSVAKALGLVRSTVAEQIAILRRDGTLCPGPRLVVADMASLARHAGIDT